LSVAEELGVAGPRLSKLFQQIFAVTKKVRTDTIIGENSLSVAYISMLLAKKHFNELNNLRVLLVGAGDTIQTVARHFTEQGVRQLSIANQTLENAAWGEKLNAEIISLDALPQALVNTDIVITALESEKIISKEMIKAL